MTETDTQPDLFGEPAWGFFKRMMEKHPDKRILFQKACFFCHNYLRPPYTGTQQREPDMSVGDFAEWITLSFVSAGDPLKGLQWRLREMKRDAKRRQEGFLPAPGKKSQIAMIDVLREEGFLLRTNAAAK